MRGARVLPVREIGTIEVECKPLFSLLQFHLVTVLLAKLFQQSTKEGQIKHFKS